MKSLATGLLLGLSLHAGELWAVPITFNFTDTVTPLPVLAKPSIGASGP